jgi:predicted ATP-grasp superfamily ATP-dependent carboligase
MRDLMEMLWIAWDRGTPVEVPGTGPVVVEVKARVEGALVVIAMAAAVGSPESGAWEAMVRKKTTEHQDSWYHVKEHDEIKGGSNSHTLYC